MNELKKSNGNGSGDVLELFRDEYGRVESEVLSIPDYLAACGDDPTMYSSVAGRLVKAIGEPEIVDTSTDPRLSRVFQNRTIRRYPVFNEFYGREDTIERIVDFFRAAEQGLEERKQILYLMGPASGGKSSIAEKLKELIELEPVYVLTVERDGKSMMSPIFESPLGLFNPERYGDLFEKKYHIDRHRLTGLVSPWIIKRLDENSGDIGKLGAVKIYPSKLRQLCVAKVEPGDENNQDISSLVGKIDIRMLEHFSQNDPDAYSYSGGLNMTTQGLMEFVEMFKAPIKVLHPLLTATQEGNYTSTEGVGAFPYQGTILAHSNEAEWDQFKSNKNNEAFLDRICVIKVPYVLQVTEEAQIYRKLLRNSKLHDAPCADETLENLARFAVLTRIKEHENSLPYSKMRVYDGENLKDTDPKARSMSEYRDTAGVTEGMTGISPRFSFKVLSRTFNFDLEEVSADPVHLFYVLESAIKQEQLRAEIEETYLGFLKAELAPRYAEKLGEIIQKAYVESYDDYGQNLFDRYIERADAWIEETDFKDPDTGQMVDREALDQELSRTEKPAGIANPKDFRNEVVKFVLRARAKPKNRGKNPKWTSYEKLREVIEKRMFSQIEDLLPTISFGAKKDANTDKKHRDFVERMKSRGYTERQVRRLVEWYIRVNKAG